MAQVSRASLWKFCELSEVCLSFLSPPFLKSPYRRPRQTFTMKGYTEIFSALQAIQSLLLLLNPAIIE